MNGNEIEEEGDWKNQSMWMGQKIKENKMVPFGFVILHSLNSFPLLFFDDSLISYNEDSLDVRDQEL